MLKEEGYCTFSVYEKKQPRIDDFHHIISCAVRFTDLQHRIIDFQLFGCASDFYYLFYQTRDPFSLLTVNFLRVSARRRKKFYNSAYCATILQIVFLLAVKSIPPGHFDFIARSVTRGCLPRLCRTACANGGKQLS